jgi:AcrR family transcriptional regulator
MANAIDASTAGTPSEERASTRARILDVAERLFAQRGLAATAVRDIAREAGLTAPSLYNHFEGKQALYDAVLARGVQPLFDLISPLGQEDDPATAAASREAPPGERAGEFLDAIVDHFAAHPDLAKLIQHESLTGGASLSQIVEGWLRPIVAGGLAAMKRDPDNVWSEDEQPMAVAAWIHVILGHFAMAPLLRELFGVDPFAPEQLARHKQFLRRYAQLMMGG